ncbi:phage tail assembly chaperone [Desulfosporosinus sp. SB140]|uniref:phage tail assembly chaperone n=1 Tax=Desulfosporosinus paludis TaxID=3115649 RepID=UPI003890FDA9
MEVKKKLSIADLIANADKIKARKAETRELYVKSLNATVTIVKPSRAAVLDSYEIGEGAGNSYLVYECVTEPSFKDTALQAAYNATGYEVLDQILDSGEIDSIAKEIIGFAGYGTDSVSVVEDVKN